MTVCEWLDRKPSVHCGLTRAQARVAIRALSTLSVEMITIGIQQTKIMTGQQIVKNEEGTEVVLSFGKTPAGVMQQSGGSGANMPRYLDDEEENIEPEVSKQVCW